MTELLKVATLGSCRIANPMQGASAAGRISLANFDVGYLHTTSEVLQVLDWLDGESVEPALHGLLPFPRGAGVPSRPEVDVFIIEISSLKKVIVGDWVLQLNYFTERFRGDENLLKTFQETIRADQRDRRAILLGAQPGFAELDVGSRRVLVDSYVETVSRDELERDMLEICQRLATPVLFVTHCNIPGQHGQILRDRERISSWMAEMSETLGFCVYDPTAEIVSFGIERAMSDEGRGLAHFTEAFQETLAQRLIAEALGAISRYPTRNWPPVGNARSTPRRIGPNAACGSIRTLAPELLQKGDLPAAAAAARAAIAASPPCANAMVVLAQTAFRAGNSADALDYALIARDIDPANSAALVVAAKVRTRQKQFEKAAEDWLDVAKLRPRSAWPLVEAGRCELRAKRPEVALELAGKALRHEPADSLALAIKAEALLRLGRYDHVPEVGEELAQTAPEAALSIIRFMLSSQHYAGLARIAHALSRSELGVSEGLRNEIVGQLKAEVETVCSQKDWPAAGELLRAVIAFDNGDAGAIRMLNRLTMDWVAVARTAVRAGDHVGACESYDVALAVDPCHLRALREAASAAEKMGSWERAADLWARTSNMASSEVADLVRAARAAEMAGQSERALLTQHRLLQADPANAKASSSFASNVRKLSKRARQLEQEQDAAEATRLASSVLTVSPDNDLCRRIVRKAEALLASDLRRAKASGRSADEEALARRLLTIAPYRPEALRTLSQMEFAQGRLNDAATLLRRLVAAQSDVPAHWVKLGRCLKLLKRFNEARDAALKALTLDPGSPAARKILADVENHLA